MYIGGVLPAPPPLPSRHRTKPAGLVSGARGLKNVKRRKRPLQQHLLSTARPQHPETPQQDQPLTPDEHSATPRRNQPLTPREQFAEFYRFALPPPPPQQEDPYAGYPYECGGGSRLSPSPPFRRLLSSHAPSSTLTYDHDDLLAIFNAQLVHSKTQSSTSTPGTQKSPTKRERSILPPGAEGKLLVPDVNLKARGQCISSASINSTPSMRGPSRKSRIPDSDKGVLTLLTLRQPSFKTRPWSYDGMQTYVVPELPRKKQTRVITEIVDGVEAKVEIEVEVHEKPKKLFLFAPKIIPVH